MKTTGKTKQIIRIFCSCTLFISMNHCLLLAMGMQQALEQVKNKLPANLVVLEGGGYIGKGTKKIKEIFPAAIIHVFEPVICSFESLTKNIEQLSNIFAYPIALHSNSGTVKFYLNKQVIGNSSIDYPSPFIVHQFDKNPIEVDCITIDDWSATYNVNKIDLLILDIEGHELSVLQSAKNSLKNVSVACIKVNTTLIRQNACIYISVKKFFEENKFKEVWKNIGYLQGYAVFLHQRLL